METRTISVSLDPELVRQMDERTRELDLDRSKYLRRLVREDLAEDRASSLRLSKRVSKEPECESDSTGPEVGP